MPRDPRSPRTGPPKGAHPATYAEAARLLAGGQAPETVAAALRRLATGDATRARAVVAAVEASPRGEALAAAVGPEPLASGRASARGLVRRLLGGEAAARVRVNPIARNEGFACLHCGLQVEPTDRGPPRSHCPRCLRSRHVDVVPGDRAASCLGLMDPVSYEVRADDVVMLHRCRACGFERSAKALAHATPQPDDLAVALALGSGGGR